MTVEVKTTEPVAQEQKQNDKEYNFRALEAKFRKELESERADKERIVRELEEARKSQQRSPVDEEEDDSEPYVDKKRLHKTLSKFEKHFEEKIDKKAEEKARKLFDEEKKNSWLDANKDFYDVMQHAEKILQKSPELADSILRMPDGFERQKLVYANIKALRLHEPESKQPSIQEKIDANRRSAYYQAPMMGTPAYSPQGDFSEGGQKNAYQKMKELQSRMRI